MGEEVGRQLALRIKILKNISNHDPLISFLGMCSKEAIRWWVISLQPTFIGYSKWARHSAQYFTYISSLKPQNNLTRCVLTVTLPWNRWRNKAWEDFVKYVQVSKLHGYLGFGPTSEPRALSLHWSAHCSVIAVMFKAEKAWRQSKRLAIGNLFRKTFFTDCTNDAVDVYNGYQKTIMIKLKSVKYCHPAS